MQREIGIIIRVKDAAKAKEEIKGIVDNKLLGNVKAATDNFNKMGNEVQKSGEKARKTKGEFDSFFTSLTKGAGALYAIRRGINMAFGSFEAGAGLERAAIQFESSIGNINTMLPQLRAATRGTVEDMRLLQTANRAVIEGLNPKSLTKMYQMATVASRKLGLDSQQSIQTISNAITAQDESALKTLGTILKTNIGYKVQTAIISKNAGVMSGAAAIAIRQSVIMNELNKRFGGFNALQEDGVEIIQKFKAALSNLRASLGPVIGIVMAPLLKVVTAVANGLSRMLDLLKDNKAFRAVVQTLGVFIATLASSKAITMIGFLVGKLGLFVGGLKALKVALVAMGISQLFDNFEGLGTSLKFAGTALSVFYQLISGFDSKTGLSTVVTKDKEALGSFYKVVFQGAKLFLSFGAVVNGVFKGVASVIKPLASLFGVFGEGISEALQALSSGQPLMQSTLNKLERLGSVLGQTITLFSLAFGPAAIKAMVTYFSIQGMHVLSLTKKYWGLAAAHAAANPITAIVAGTGAALYIGNQMAEEAGLNIDKGYDPRGYKINAPSSSFQQAAPDIRDQNIQAVSKEEDSKVVKILTGILESNMAMNEKEEQRDIRERVQPVRDRFRP